MARRQSQYETIGEENEEDHLIPSVEKSECSTKPDDEKPSFVSQFPRWIQMAITISLFMGGLNMVNIHCGYLMVDITLILYNCHIDNNKR